METIGEAWAGYQHEVLPECFSEGSRDVVQHAFYHGAIALLMIGHTYRQRGLNDEERAALMDGIIDEIHEFHAGCEVKMLLHLLAGAVR